MELQRKPDIMVAIDSASTFVNFKNSFIKFSFIIAVVRNSVRQ